MPTMFELSFGSVTVASCLVDACVISVFNSSISDCECPMLCFKFLHFDYALISFQVLPEFPSIPGTFI